MKNVWRCCSGSSSSRQKTYKRAREEYDVYFLLSRIHKFMFTNVNFNDTLQRYCYHFPLPLSFCLSFSLHTRKQRPACTHHSTIFHASQRLSVYVCDSLPQSYIYTKGLTFHNKASRYKIIDVDGDALVQRMRRKMSIALMVYSYCNYLRWCYRRSRRW